MIALQRAPTVVDPDHRVILHGVNWQDYERILAMRGDHSAPRIAYLKGELELMSPSRSHEWIKTAIARILEAWSDRRGIAFEGYGSWTLKSEPRERGAEPDECYMVGDLKKEVPDLAIEVIWTSGGLDKLEIYRGLGVGEVWVWEEDGIEIFQLRGDAYERVEKSACLPDVDVGVLARCVSEATSQSEAVRLFLDNAAS